MTFSPLGDSSPGRAARTGLAEPFTQASQPACALYSRRALLLAAAALLSACVPELSRYTVDRAVAVCEPHGGIGKLRVWAGNNDELQVYCNNGKAFDMDRTAVRDFNR